MKTKLLLIGVAAIMLATVSLKAQTVTTVPNLLDTNSLNSVVPQTGVVHDLALAGEDAWSNIKLAMPFTTNGQATLRIGVGVNTDSKKEVTAFMLTVPVSQNVAIGIVAANIGSTFYEGGANLTLGMTNNWPVIGTVRSFAGDGVVYDFIKRNPANYAFAGFEKDWYISSRWEVGVAVIAANTSDRAGVDLIGGAHLTYWWGKQTNPN